MSELNSDHEVPPASPGARRVRLTLGCLFMVIVATFLVWLVIENRERSDEGLRIFGGRLAEPPPATVTV